MKRNVKLLLAMALPAVIDLAISQSVAWAGKEEGADPLGTGPPGGPGSARRDWFQALLKDIGTSSIEHSLVPLRSVIDGEELVFNVSQDALKWKGVRVGVSHNESLALCDALSLFLPTQRIATLMMTSGVYTPPRPQVISDATTYQERCEKHTAAVDADLRGMELGSRNVANSGKFWLCHPLALSDKAVNYGWLMADRRSVIQAPGTAHDKWHYDYSQTFRAIGSTVTVNGQTVPAPIAFKVPPLRRHFTALSPDILPTLMGSLA